MDYIFFGAVDPTTTIISRATDYITKNGDRLLFFVDDDPIKQGESPLYPGGVYGKEEIRKYPDATIVILSSAVREICEALRKVGIENNVLAYPLFRWWFPCEDICQVNKNIYKWTEENKEAIKSIYEWSDDVTQKTINTILNQRRMENFEFVSAEEMYGFHYKEYFYDEQLRPKQNEITVVDCGAYQGDSLKRQIAIFGERVKKAYAFEPDKENFSIMKKTLGCDERIVFIEAGVSDEEKKYYFEQNEMSGHFSDDGEIEVDVKKIDDVVKEVEGTLCITMDVEGFEAAALRGAKNTILQYKPYIVACLYHKFRDIYEVPKIISEICGDYKFYLRAGTHTECYAIPNNEYIRKEN